MLRSKILRIKYLILLATNALTAVKNKIPNVSNLVKKSDYYTKISDIQNKITTDYDHNKYILLLKKNNELTSEKFTARQKQANLASKTNIANFVKKDRQILIIN